jgi:hypothetical protein
MLEAICGLTDQVWQRIDDMRIFACRGCRCVLERVEIAGGRAVVYCLTCEQIGHEHEVAQGARLIAIERVRRRR